MTATTSSLPRVRASELVGRGWLGTGGRDLTLRGLRGKLVLLDFWTFCCINCLHVIDELRPLEERYRDVLVTIGVHSPKFVHEADPDALAAAVERYEVAHPVLDDPELITWKAYTARAWPTLVLIDPEGYIVAHMAGEGHAPNLEVQIDQLIAEHETKGTLHRGTGPYVPPEPTAGLLRFPAKAVELPGGNLLVADAGHHRIVELEPDGETLVRAIGSGERGRTDGPADVGKFSEPNGLCVLPREVAAEVGYDVVVADTVNHLLRGLRLADGEVTTIAGTGEQFMVGAPDNVLPEPGNIEPATEDYGPALRIKLSSPWDVTWSARTGGVVVAMAGNHTLWAFDPLAGHVSRLGGTMNEGLVDGELGQAWFAQPSGLSAAAGGRVWLADAETSALRYVEGGQVRTAVGQGLFDFGHRDGPADDALLQHPLGVAALPDGRVAVADTYNGAVRLYDPATAQVATVATDLAEPSGLMVVDDGAHLVVVESAAHRLTRIPVPDGAGSRHDGGAHRTRRPVTEVAPQFTLRVVFTPPEGQQLDDRFGPSTQLEVAAAPDGALIAGEGSGTELARLVTLSLGTVDDEGAGHGADGGPGACADRDADGETGLGGNRDAAGGTSADRPSGPGIDRDAGDGEPAHTVLSVTAKAASCDADPAVEFPACHLAAQDWGIPVRVVQGGPAELVLNLHG